MAESAAQIVVIGDAWIEEIRDRRGVREVVGGAAFTVAAGLSRLVQSVALMAMVGADAAGARIRRVLDDHRVSLWESPAPLGTARVLEMWSDAGEPLYRYSDAARQRRIRFDVSARDAISAAPLVVVGGFPFDVPEEVTRLRDASAGARLLIAPNPRQGLVHDRDAFVRGLAAMVPGADVRLSDEDAVLLFDSSTDAVPWLLAAGASAVIVTLGTSGALLAWPGGRVQAATSVLPGRIIDVAAFDAAVTTSVAHDLARHGTAIDRQGTLERALAVAAATHGGGVSLVRTPAMERRSPPARGGS